VIGRVDRHQGTRPRSLTVFRLSVAVAEGCIASAPANVSPLSKRTVWQLLNRHPILRQYADTVLGTLRKTASQAAVAEAARIQLRSHKARLCVVSREL